MKLYGYAESKGEPSPRGPSVLAEVSVCASAEELRKIAAFLLFCADEIERMGTTFDHLHLGDSEHALEDSPGLIVARA